MNLCCIVCKVDERRYLRMNDYFSDMWNQEMNNRLLDFYVEMADTLDVSDDVKKSLSAPLLVHASPSYIENVDKRVILVGKETMGWVDSYQKFCRDMKNDSAKSCKKMMESQAWFMLYDRKSKYKYWQMYKMMAKRGYNDLLSASQLWANLFPVDYHGHSYLGIGRGLQYDKMPREYFSSLRLYAEKMLKGITNILKPRIIVFCTGSTYDEDLYSFLDVDSKHTVSLKKLPECAAKEENAIDLTGTVTFVWNGIRCIRTEHPRRLESRGTKCVKKIIVDTVYNLIESE